MYLFSLGVWVLFSFFSCVSGGGGCFSPLFTFHILWNSALSFPPCDMEYGASETTVRFKSKMGGVGVILNYWTQAETWAMDMAPDFPPLRFFLCLCQLRGFLSVVGTMRGWCLHSEGDVLYSDLVQMHPIMIMFCYLYVPPVPVPLWKPERCKQLHRLLPFSQVFTTAALLSHHTDGGSSSSRCSSAQPAGVFREQTECKNSYTHTHPTLSTYLHKYTSTNVRVSCFTFCLCLDKPPQLFATYKKYLHVMFLNSFLGCDTPTCSAAALVWALKTISCHVTPKAP